MPNSRALFSPTFTASSIRSPPTNASPSWKWSKTWKKKVSYVSDKNLNISSSFFALEGRAHFHRHCIMYIPRIYYYKCQDVKWSRVIRSI